jgi:Replication-relaxation
MTSRNRRPRRVSLRSRSGGSSIMSIVHRIQERDVKILFDLYEHRVLTTHQLVELHFPSYRVGWRRLSLLEQMGLILRFRPLRLPGSAPFHFVLDEPGALLVALRLDTDLKGLGYRWEDAIRIARSRNLAHWVQSNGIFTRLAWACRRSGSVELVEWLGERQCRRGWGVRIEPDSVGRISDGHTEVWFFFELDRGTENHGKLRAKLQLYSDLAILPDVPGVLLFVFPTDRRELEARKSLYPPGLTVATTTLDRALSDPLGPVWQPLSQPFRLPLLELPMVSSQRTAV